MTYEETMNDFKEFSEYDYDDDGYDEFTLYIAHLLHETNVQLKRIATVLEGKNDNRRNSK